MPDIPTENRQFGPFRLIERLGGGDFGDVHRAEGPADLTGGIGRCALKILWRDDERARKRLQNEVYALSRLSHPSIAAHYSHGDQPRPYIAMELLAGTSLRAHRRKTAAPLDAAVVVELLRSLLVTLKYVHENGVAHRDIKDDNVLVDERFARLWLVDFGFCRATGQPADPATWNDVGSNLYAPPAKLDHPSEVVLNHDVFAAGVLAYLLLTSQYPWFVEKGDRGNLVELMRTQQPIPLARLAPQTPKWLAAFIRDLLEVNDQRRYSAEEALDALDRLRNKQLPADIQRAFFTTSRPICPRVFRDPLHGDIRLTEHEWSVINTPEFQRLGHIRQLGTTHYVYRGANHTRLLHCLGTLHVTERTLTSAEEVHGDSVDEETRLIARLYALVHDITHIPFGHTLEDELGLFPRHDRNYARMDRIVGSRSQVAKVLRAVPAGQQVLQYFNEAPTIERSKLVEEMLGSSVGPDAIDYIDRDAYFCGLDDRLDSAIYRRFRIARSGAQEEHFVPALRGKRGLRLDAASAVGKVFATRYALYEKVYCHRVKVCTGAMLGKALHTACSPGRGGAPPEITEEIIERLGDDELLLKLRGSGRSEVRAIAERLWTRELFLTAFVASVIPEEAEETDINVDDRVKEIHEICKVPVTTPEGRADLEAQIASKVKGVSRNQIIVYLPAKPPGYHRLRQYYDIGRELVKTDRRIDRQFAEIRRRHLALWKAYVFCGDANTKVLARVSDVVEELTGFKNELPSSGQARFLF